jgi:hypothetical protein
MLHIYKHISQSTHLRYYSLKKGNLKKSWERLNAFQSHTNFDVPGNS